MSPDETHRAGTLDKIVRMANQIATFFKSKPRTEGIDGIAEHINKFWDPRMRTQLFELLDKGDSRLDEMVVVASEMIRRPVKTDA